MLGNCKWITVGDWTSSSSEDTGVVRYQWSIKVLFKGNKPTSHTTQGKRNNLRTLSVFYEPANGLAWVEVSKTYLYTKHFYNESNLLDSVWTWLNVNTGIKRREDWNSLKQ